MRYFSSKPMFFCFYDCLIKRWHCFKLFIICLFHVRLSHPNADMKCSNSFADCLKDPLIVQKEKQDCFAYGLHCFIGANSVSFGCILFKSIRKKVY